MSDTKDSSKQGKALKRWTAGAVVAALLALLPWQCNSCRGDQGSQESPASLAQQTAQEQPSVTQEVQVPHAQEQEPRTQQVVSPAPAAEQPSATPKPAEKADEPVGRQPKPVYNNKVSVGTPGITETPENAETPDTPELVEHLSSDRESPENPVTAEASVTAESPENPVSPVTAEHRQVNADSLRQVNVDSLRQVLSDSIRQAMLAELQPKEDAPDYNGIALRTNLLYDAALIPTIGAEFDLGKLWSVGFDYNGTWFYSPSRHRYWQTIGGYLMLRKYLKADDEGRPFMGHHVGVYGQLLTFDIEFGDRGWQGAYPNWGGGVEYGYSAYLSERLNIDFSIGVGYLRLKYKDYDPDGDSFKWRSTHRRNWWGPTKAEISLKWLLTKRKKHQTKGNRR